MKGNISLNIVSKKNGIRLAFSFFSYFVAYLKMINLRRSHLFIFQVTFIYISQQSWSDKMVERVRNVIKRDKKRTVE